MSLRMKLPHKLKVTQFTYCPSQDIAQTLSWAGACDGLDSRMHIFTQHNTVSFSWDHQYLTCLCLWHNYHSVPVPVQQWPPNFYLACVVEHRVHSTNRVILHSRSFARVAQSLICVGKESVWTGSSFSTQICNKDWAALAVGLFKELRKATWRVSLGRRMLE